LSKDISNSLDGWDYDPDRISVRIVTGDDGREKIQMRLELGLLQMDFDGRPDGKKIAGNASWLDFYEKQAKKQAASDSTDDNDEGPFVLESEDCQRLLREGIQYYHRYVSFWHLERFELCARDTNRNLRLLAFVRKNAREDKDKLQFDQWRPYITMMHARAVATPLVAMREYTAALGAIDAAIDGIREFLAEYEQNAANCNELTYLQKWREELLAKTSGDDRDVPFDPVASLQAELDEAVRDERFEDAAKLRDSIRQQTQMTKKKPFTGLE
jgi:hypothetical protein